MITLKEGDKAPAFKAFDQNGNTVSLKNYKGKKLALYFYPQDLTETCTIQACNLRDNYSSLGKAGIEVLGVSPDDAKKHKKFEAKNELPFPLIADTETKLAQQYGVWGPKIFMGRHYIGLHRTTFLINEKGIIKKIFTKPKSKMHAEEILEGFQ